MRCARMENTLPRGTHDQCDAHGRVVPRRNGGHTGCGAVARLCLTLPRTIPRLRVLILISPFKFLRPQAGETRRPTFHRPRPGIVFRARVREPPAAALTQHRPLGGPDERFASRRRRGSIPPLIPPPILRL